MKALLALTFASLTVSTVNATPLVRDISSLSPGGWTG
jgi:hypothetical protein